ncbi:hypothetical protein ACQ86K_03580 [Mucilaginibacter sp. P19]
MIFAALLLIKTIAFMVTNSITRFSNRVEDYVKYRPGYPDETC